ncbi:hypothetical protein M9H77_02054 [Catharanthus roseus]|uniref:Uncharacterized protein n=1 Tax=Catharanthus roseus TaxID=4058 RepID=A0ACC0C7B7_CATRO|nr:hypothetical protein M9H77_02054 [Catharanthus roseus]
MAGQFIGPHQIRNWVNQIPMVGRLVAKQPKALSLFINKGLPKVKRSFRRGFRRYSRLGQMCETNSQIKPQEFVASRSTKHGAEKVISDDLELFSVSIRGHAYGFSEAESARLRQQAQAAAGALFPIAPSKQQIEDIAQRTIVEEVDRAVRLEVQHRITYVNHLLYRAVTGSLDEMPGYPSGEAMSGEQSSDTSLTVETDSSHKHFKATKILIRQSSHACATFTIMPMSGLYSCMSKHVTFQDQYFPAYADLQTCQVYIHAC